MAMARTDSAAAGLTPSSRAIAALAAAAAFGVGFAAPRSRAARYPVGLWATSVVAVSVALAFAGRRDTLDRQRRPPPARGRPGQNPRVSVLVPARDEAGVIEEVLGDLGRQDLRDADGRPGYAVTVIDDRSTDGTGPRASAALLEAGLDACSHVVRRDAGADGKGAALAAADAGEPTSSRLLIVLDADARLDPQFLRRAAEAVADGDVALTARRRMQPPMVASLASRGRWRFRLAGWLAEAQDAEQTLDGKIQRARWRLRGASEWRGDGMAIRADVLASLGGWDPTALCEDLELSTRLYASTGRGVRWMPDLVVWEQPVSTISTLLRQRVRWAEGAVRRELRVTLPVAARRGLPLRRRVEPMAGTLLLLAPWTLFGLAPWTVFGIAGGARSRAALQSWVLLAGAHLLGGACIALAVPEPTAAEAAMPRTVRIRLAAGALMISAVWLLAVPVATLRVVLDPRSLRFARTPHHPGDPTWIPGGNAVG